MSARGFRKLLGKTIVNVDTRAINIVVLKDSDGNEYELDTVSGPLQIPVIVLNKKKKNVRSKKENGTANS